MGFLSKLVKSAVSVAVTPIDVVKDIATMGGALSDQEEPYTVKRLKNAAEALDESIDDLGEGDIL